MKDLVESLLDDDSIEKKFDDMEVMKYIEKFYKKYREIEDIERLSKNIKMGDIVLYSEMDAPVVGVVLGVDDSGCFVVGTDEFPELKHFTNSKGVVRGNVSPGQIIKINKNILKLLANL